VGGVGRRHRTALPLAHRRVRHGPRPGPGEHAQPAPQGAPRVGPNRRSEAEPPPEFTVRRRDAPPRLRGRRPTEDPGARAGRPHLQRSAAAGPRGGLPWRRPRSIPYAPSTCSPRSMRPARHAGPVVPPIAFAVGPHPSADLASTSSRGGGRRPGARRPAGSARRLTERLLPSCVEVPAASLCLVSSTRAQLEMQACTQDLPDLQVCRPQRSLSVLNGGRAATGATGSAPSTSWRCKPHRRAGHSPAGQHRPLRVGSTPCPPCGWACAGTSRPTSTARRRLR
jgi:hypothetical protein